MASGSESGCKEVGDPPCRKDKIDQWIKGGVDLVSLIDKGDIIDVDDVKQYLDCSGGSADIDKTNKFAGQTPLMIACRKSQTAIVKFLLEAGANPNLMCVGLGNSALHYACHGEGDVVLMCRQKPNYPKEKLQEIIKIVELLANHGAVPGVNADGLSPVCVAALNSFKDVVEFFASSNVITMPIADKVKAYVLLGVSQAVFDKHHLIDACESFHLAALHSKDDNDDTPHHGAWFYDMNKKNMSESDKFQVKAKALVIGLQCLPDKIKSKRSFRNILAEYAEDALTSGTALEEAYSLLVALINKEFQAEYMYTFNAVLEMLKRAAGERPASSKKLLLIPKLLEVYAEAFRVGNCRPSRRKCKDMLELLAGVLLNLAYYQTKLKWLDQSLLHVECLVNCIKNIFDGDTSQNTDEGKLSIITPFFGSMGDVMSKDMFNCQSKKPRNRLEYVIRRMLYFNGLDPDPDNSVLQALLNVIPVAADMEFVLSVSRVLIRYGCPTGDTYLEDHVDETEDGIAELLELLSPPTTPISLEELASRTILCNAIPYRDTLPIVLCEKIEGDLLRFDPYEVDSSCDSDSD